jgi:hypothetical protein
MSPKRTALVRIVNDDPHSAHSAHIYDAETGEELSGWVQRVDITLDAADGPPFARIKAYFPQFDIVANAEIEMQPIDLNSIESVEFSIVMLKRRLRELTNQHTEGAS